jgi:hypothetical protein
MRSNTLTAWVGQDGIAVCDGFHAASMRELARQLQCFGWRPSTRIAIKRADDDALIADVLVRDLLAGEEGDPSDAPGWWRDRPVKQETSDVV